MYNNLDKYFTNRWLQCLHDSTVEGQVDRNVIVTLWFLNRCFKPDIPPGTSWYFNDSLLFVLDHEIRIFLSISHFGTVDLVHDNEEVSSYDLILFYPIPSWSSLFIILYLCKERCLFLSIWPRKIRIKFLLHFCQQRQIMSYFSMIILEPIFFDSNKFLNYWSRTMAAAKLL